MQSLLCTVLFYAIKKLIKHGVDTTILWLYQHMVLYLLIEREFAIGTHSLFIFFIKVNIILTVCLKKLTLVLNR